MALTYTKLTGGVPSASSFYNDFGTVDAIADSNVATGWSGGASYTATDFVGLNFPAALEVRKIEAYFHTWGKTIVVAVANSWSGVKSGYTVIRTIDVTVTPNDDLGVPWGRFVTNTILLPAGVAVGRAVVLWTNHSAVSIMSGAGGVDRQRLMEISMYSGMDTGSAESPYRKINNGSVFASSTLSGSSAITVTDDGVWAGTYWEGNGANATSYTDFIGRLFTTPIRVKQIKVQFYRWSRYIRIGYATGQPGTKSGFTLLREIDTKTQTVDDEGVAWAGRPNAAIHTINLPEYTAAMAIGIYQGDTQEGGPLSDNLPSAGVNSRVGVHEAQYFMEGARLPNPKPPATVPVLPFTATPANWTRTEFKTPGTFNFTPAADTTLVLAIAQGGGAGGQIYYNRSGSKIQLTGNETGGDAVVKVAKGEVLRAKGGKSYTAPDPIVQASNQIEVDWLRYVDNSGRQASYGGLGATSGYAGGTSYLNGTGGTAFTVQPQDLNSGFVAQNLFQGPTPPAVTPVNDGYTQTTNSDGFASNKFGSGDTGSLSFTFNAIAGQVLGIGYGRSASSVYPGPAYVYVNDVLLASDVSAYLGSKNVNYTVTQDGPVKVEHRYTRTAPLSTATTTFRSIAIIGAQYGGQQGGASGGLGQVYLLPEPLTLTVPIGGKGAKGDHTNLTVAQNGTLGGGGAAGGDGGDGAIIIYEFKGGIVNENQPLPSFANYNSLTLDTGVYRTQYPGDISETVGQKSFTHTLRPTTKSVIALVVGAGGGARSGTSAISEEWSSTTLAYNGKFFEAGGGWCGSKVSNTTGSGGIGGTFKTPEGVTDYSDGKAGSSTASSTTNPSTIAGLFGSGGASGYLNSSGGGTGSWGLLVLDASGSDRTIELQVGNGQIAAQTGVVFIYETELPIPTTVTQVAELVLQKEPVGPTQVTQVSELVLQKDPIAPTRLTQVVMMVLQREPKNAQVAVTESYLDVVTPAERGNTRVSQSLQSVLIESDPIDQYVSQVAALVLVREIPTLLDRMDFGVMRYPEKFTLYDSDIKTVSGIGGGGTLRVQLEGDLPEGSTLLINGEDISALTAIVKDGDTIQLRSGILNFFVTKHTLYAYISRGNQIIREIAGWWSILQADLTPRKRATIGVVGKFVGILVAKGDAVFAKQTWKKDANSTVLAPKQTAQKAATTGVIAPKQTALKTEALDAIGAVQYPVKAAGHASKFDSAGTKVAKQYAVLSDVHGFTVAPVKIVMWKNDLWINAGTSKTEIWKPTWQASVGPTFSQAEVRYRASVSPGASKTGISAEVGAKGAQANADQQYTNAFAGGSETWTMLEFAVAAEQSTTFAYSVYVYAPTVVFSNIELVEYTVQERDKVTYYKPDWQKVEELGDVKSTPVWQTPPKDFAVVVKAIEAVGAVAAHIHLWGKNDWVSIHANETGKRNREFAVNQFGAGSGADQHWLHRVNSQLLSPKSTYAVVKRNATLIPVGYKVAKANATLFGMKPMLYQAGKNKISAAKYYMGFTTKAEVDAFIVNFLKPTTKTKLDGWVYRVGVDDTLVCEVRGPNMPIAWLMHGG
jgi:hypothetical protein